MCLTLSLKGFAGEELNVMGKKSPNFMKEKPKKGLKLGEIGAQFFLECLLVLLILAN